MFKYFAILIIAVIAMPFNFASYSDSGFYNNILSIDEQGGKIDFTSAQFYSKSNSVKNSGSLVLHDYSGLPVKAIQFDIKLLNTEGKIKINSIEAGEDIPHDQFLMDYQIYPGIPESDGSSVDTIKVVILGNGDNVLINKRSFDLVKIVYDVKPFEADTIFSALQLTNVLGATSYPVQDARLIPGDNSQIILTLPGNSEQKQLHLEQNFPNPFNPSTKINFSLAQDGLVEIKIFNAIGQEIFTLLNEYKSAGSYGIDFNADALSSGVYFYQVSSNNSIEIRKMILAK